MTSEVPQNEPTTTKPTTKPTGAELTGTERLGQR